MGRSQQSFSKKEREKKKRKKKKEKRERREQRKMEKEDRGKLTLEDQLSYVDHNGNLVDEKPDPDKKKKVKAEDIIIGIPPKDESATQKIRKGIVSDFKDDKGYGFIVDHDTRDSYFVHISEAYDTIQIKDEVTFEIENGPKGPNAVRVTQVKN